MRDAIKAVFWGMVWIIGVCCFMYSLVGNPLDELALIHRAVVTTGVLVDSFEDGVEDERGCVHCIDVGNYAYHVPDGREFKTTTRVRAGQLKEELRVEYLPDDPAINRIKGDGCQSVWEWLWRKVGLGSVLLGLLLSPGITVTRRGIQELKRARREAKQSKENAPSCL